MLSDWISTTRFFDFFSGQNWTTLLAFSLSSMEFSASKISKVSVYFYYKYFCRILFDSGKSWWILLLKLKIQSFFWRKCYLLSFLTLPWPVSKFVPSPNPLYWSSIWLHSLVHLEMMLPSENSSPILSHGFLVSSRVKLKSHTKA